MSSVSFFGKEEIKTILGQMAAIKLNRMRWHLTDDHGWRIEIKKYPKSVDADFAIKFIFNSNNIEGSKIPEEVVKRIIETGNLSRLRTRLLNRFSTGMVYTNHARLYRIDQYADRS